MELKAVKNIKEVTVGAKYNHTNNGLMTATAVDVENNKATFTFEDGTTVKEYAFGTIKRHIRLVVEEPKSDVPFPEADAPKDEEPVKHDLVEGEKVNTTTYGEVTIWSLGSKAVTFKFVNAKGYDEEQTLMLDKFLPLVTEADKEDDAPAAPKTLEPKDFPKDVIDKTDKMLKDLGNKKKDKPAAKKDDKKDSKPARRGRKRSPESIETFCLDLLKEGGTVADMANSLEEILTEKKIKFTDCKMRVRRAIYYAEKECPGFKLTKDASNGRGNTIYKLVEKN